MLCKNNGSKKQALLEALKIQHCLLRMGCLKVQSTGRRRGRGTWRECPSLGVTYLWAGGYVAGAFRRKNSLERVDSPANVHSLEPTCPPAAPPWQGVPPQPGSKRGGNGEPTDLQRQPSEAPCPPVPPASEIVETCSIAVGLGGAGLRRREIVSNVHPGRGYPMETCGDRDAWC